MADGVLAIVDLEAEAAQEVARLVAEGDGHHRVGPAVLPEDRESGQPRSGQGRDCTPGHTAGVGHDAAEPLGPRQRAGGGHRRALAEADQPDPRRVGAVGPGRLVEEAEDGAPALDHLLEVDAGRELAPVDVEPGKAHGLRLARRASREHEEAGVEVRGEAEEVLLVGAQAVEQHRHGRPPGGLCGRADDVLERHQITRSEARFPGPGAFGAGSRRPARRASRATTLPTRS